MTTAGTFRPAALVQGFDFSAAAGVGTLTICRPEKRNALSRDMWRALPAIIAEVDAHPGLHALIITGAGGHFSAGSDIADLNVPLDDFWALNSAAEAAVKNADIPTIAAIEGNCVGGGTEIAAACDIRVAKPGSIYGITAGKLGLVYPPGPTATVAEVLGTSFARYLLVTAEIVDFAQMDRRGFFHAVSDEPLAAAQEIAAKLATRAQLSQTAVKRMLRGEHLDASPGSRLADAYAEEIVRGQEAFANRETPQFGVSRTDF